MLESEHVANASDARAQLCFSSRVTRRVRRLRSRRAFACVLKCRTRRLPPVSILSFSGVSLPSPTHSRFAHRRRAHGPSRASACDLHSSQSSVQLLVTPQRVFVLRDWRLADHKFGTLQIGDLSVR